MDFQQRSYDMEGRPLRSDIFIKGVNFSKGKQRCIFKDLVVLYLGI